MIGVIADDVTGATDVAAALGRAGLRTVLALNTEAPLSEQDLAAVDAIVVGLKTRSIPVAEAVQASLEALRALRGVGANRFYFKYCSTFDSTPEGNIGPVTEALAIELGVDTVVTTPAAPIHGRTVAEGHLLIDGVPLHETHMAQHPITPMLDSSLERLLAPQVSGGIGTLQLETVRAGAAAVTAAIAAATASAGAWRVAHVIADAVEETDLRVIAEAVEGHALVAGSAGLVGAMAEREPASGRELGAPAPGRTAIIAGSCSRRTLEQIAAFRAAGGPSHHVVAQPGDSAEGLAAAALAWWDAQPGDASALIYSSSPAAERDARIPNAGELYEDVAGIVARELSERGVTRMLIAGGETSGAVIRELGTAAAVVGAEAAVGAPWIHDTERDAHLVLKSGNFGGPDFFVDVALAGGAR